MQTFIVAENVGSHTSIKINLQYISGCKPYFTSCYVYYFTCYWTIH